MYHKLTFYKGIDDEDPNNRFKIEAENLYFRNRFLLGKDDEKLCDLVSSMAVFDNHAIKSMTINSFNNAVWEQKSDEGLVPYQPKITPTGKLINPYLEAIFKDLGCMIGDDVESDQGDYYLSQEMISRFNLGMLRKILESVHVSEIEIKIEKIFVKT